MHIYGNKRYCCLSRHEQKVYIPDSWFSTMHVNMSVILLISCLVNRVASANELLEITSLSPQWCKNRRGPSSAWLRWWHLLLGGNHSLQLLCSHSSCSLQRNDGSPEGDAGEVPWCQCSAGTQGHQHRQQWSYHLSHPSDIKWWTICKISTLR